MLTRNRIEISVIEDRLGNENRNGIGHLFLRIER